MTTVVPRVSHKIFDVTVLIAGLGYFIDMYDFFLYNMLRVRSLSDMGLSGDALTQAGLMILNWQMAGILVGALLWGVLGDKIGRKKGLLASILVYGLGSCLTALVHSPETYAAARFITAIGLAGEIGAGVALISERLSASKRGYGVMVFISAGYAGVIMAGLCASLLPWRADYVIGGVAGLAILLTRMLLPESHLFLSTKSKPVTLGGFMPLLRRPVRLLQFLCGICLLITATYTPQIIWTLSPEISKGMGISAPIQAPMVLMIGFTCGILADLASQYLSEKWRSRKKAVLVFLLLSIAARVAYLLWPHQTMTSFLIFNGLQGFTFGVWMITLTWLAEHFGTNIRATVTTTSPSFSRALTVPMNMAYGALLKGHGAVAAVGIIGAVVFALALLGWFGLEETYGRDLDYAE